MRTSWFLFLGLGLLLWGCPADPPADDDDAADDDTGDDDAADDDADDDDTGDDDSISDDDLGDDDSQGGDDDAGDDDAADDDSSDDDSGGGDDDDTSPNADSPVIGNGQAWVEFDPKYQEDALLYSVDYTDPQGDLSGGEGWVVTVDIDGIATGLGGPHNLPDGPSGTFESFANFVGAQHGYPPGYEVTIEVRISDGAMNWSNELSIPYTLP